MTKNILITGANGFIGKNILRQLNKSDFNIYVIVRKNNVNKLNFSNEIKVIFTDNIFEEKYEWFIEKLKNINFVIHAAWFMEHGELYASRKNIESLIGSIELAKACKDLGIEKFIGIGTCFEYSLDKDYLDIQTPLEPKTLYGSCKASLYLILENLFCKSQTCFSWCRLFYLYGEGENNKRLYPYLENNLSQKKQVLLGNGEDIYDYMNISEAAKEITKILIKDKKGVYNICSGKGLKLKDIAISIASKYDALDCVNFKLLDKSKANIIVGIKNE